MNWKGNLPLHSHLVDRGVLGRIQPLLWNAIIQRLPDNRWIVRIQEHIQLRLIEVFRVVGTRSIADLVRIVEHYPHVSDSADAGFGADSWHARFDTWIAEDAFFRLAGLPVVINLLVGAGTDTHAPAAAAVLIDQDRTVLLTLVNGAGGTTGDTGRVEAVVAQTRQVHVERFLEILVHLLLDAFEVPVL